MIPERCVIEIDWSMLELRLGAQVAQCSAMIEEFSKGLKADLHWKTAAMIYGHPLEWQGFVDPVVQKRDRTKAKPCVVGSTLVITNNGVKPITEIQLTDKLYDGIEWVTHEGLLNQGLKETIEYGGLRATPDHIIFTEKGQVPLGYLEAGIVDAKSTRESHTGKFVAVDEKRVDLLQKHKRQKQGLYRSNLRKLSEQNDSLCGQRCSGQTKRLQMYSLPVQKTNRCIGGTILCNDTTVYESEERLLQELWRSWDSGKFHMFRVFNIYVSDVPKYVLQRVRYRSDRQQRTLRNRKLATRIPSKEFNEYTKECLVHLRESTSAGITFVAFDKNRLPKLRFEPKLDVQVSFSEHIFRANSTQGVLQERVFDIANAGPRHRFTIQISQGLDLKRVKTSKPSLVAVILNCNFGLLYGLQPKNFQLNLRKDNLFWSLEECKFAHTRFFESYPEMATMHKYWKDSLIKAYVDHTPFLEVRTLCGRRKLINIKQKIKEGKIGKKIDKYGKMYHYAFANDIVNFPIQGTGADMAKKAMIEGQRLLNKYNLDCKFMLQLHDAFYLDCAVKDAKAVIELIGKCAMIDHVQHYCPDVPLSTSVEVGASMGNSQHYCDFIYQKVV
jgi:hypothetical protein